MELEAADERTQECRLFASDYRIADCPISARSGRKPPRSFEPKSAAHVDWLPSWKRTFGP